MTKIGLQVAHLPGLVLVLMLSGAARAQAPRPGVQPLLEKTVRWEADPCNAPMPMSEESEVESRLLAEVRDQLLAALNASGSPAEAPRARVTRVLREVEALSARLNAAWPEENRFHGQSMETPPLLVVQLSFQSRAHFQAFASTGKGPTPWKEVGSETFEPLHTSPRTWLTLYPLHRGPSGGARFLASFGYAGCAGSTGTFHEVRQFDPADGLGYARPVLQQQGALGLDEVKAFPTIGKLVTDGEVLTLPYCWFSDLDTWDHPSLCAVDSYLLTGDDVVFQARRYNRPDLISLARALEFAAKHELPAVRAYCDSDAVARRMVSHRPQMGGDLHVIPHGPDAETVDTEGARFELRRRNGGWRVSGFSE